MSAAWWRHFYSACLSADSSGVSLLTVWEFRVRVVFLLLANILPNSFQWCYGFPEPFREEAAAAGCHLLRPDSEAGPTSALRGPAEENPRVGAAADGWEGVVGEKPGLGAAAAALRPWQGGRFGRLKMV